MTDTTHQDDDSDDPDDPTGAGRSAVPWLVVALVAARVAALAYLVLSHQERVDGGIAGDVHRYVEMATAQGIPYRDFQVEYPPLTYALIKLLTGADYARSIAAVAVSQFACDLGIAALLGWGWGRRARLAYLLVGLPLMAYPFVYVRVDLFTVLLAVAGLALVRRGRDVAGGLGLAAAALAKLWPLALAPVLIIERRAARDGAPRPRGLVALIAGGAAGAVAWAGLAGLSGFQQVLSFREATGWQVESVPGILWHLHDPSRIKFESGAFRTGVMPPWGRPLLTLVSLVLVAVAWVLAARRRAEGAGDHVSFADAPLAAVLAVLLFAPILSPQYIVWVLPFAALVAARGDRLVAGLAVAASAVTTLTYVLVLDAADGHLFATLPVLVRNGLLVALLAVAFQRLAGVRAGASESGAAAGDGATGTGGRGADLAGAPSR
jgi:hypothetical protein